MSFEERLTKEDIKSLEAAQGGGGPSRDVKLV